MTRPTTRTSMPGSRPRRSRPSARQRYAPRPTPRSSTTASTSPTRTAKRMRRPKPSTNATSHAPERRVSDSRLARALDLVATTDQRDVDPRARSGQPGCARRRHTTRGLGGDGVPPVRARSHEDPETTRRTSPRLVDACRALDPPNTGKSGSATRWHRGPRPRVAPSGRRRNRPGRRPSPRRLQLHTHRVLTAELRQRGPDVWAERDVGATDQLWYSRSLAIMLAGRVRPACSAMSNSRATVRALDQLAGWWLTGRTSPVRPAESVARGLVAMAEPGVAPRFDELAADVPGQLALVGRSRRVSWSDSSPDPHVSAGTSTRARERHGGLHGGRPPPEPNRVSRSRLRVHPPRRDPRSVWQSTETHRRCTRIIDVTDAKVLVHAPEDAETATATGATNSPTLAPGAARDGRPLRAGDRQWTTARRSPGSAGRRHARDRRLPPGPHAGRHPAPGPRPRRHGRGRTWRRPCCRSRP